MGRGGGARCHWWRLYRGALDWLGLSQLPLLKRHALRPIHLALLLVPLQLQVAAVSAQEQVSNDPFNGARDFFVVGGRELRGGGEVGCGWDLMR